MKDSIVLKTGSVEFTYSIVKIGDEKLLELRAHNLPDDLYNTLMNVDLENGSPLCESFCHEINPEGDWILGCIRIKQ